MEKNEKDFYKHLNRKDLEPTEKQIKKFKRRYNRPNKINIIYFYAGIVVMFVIFQLIRLL